MVTKITLSERDAETRFVQFLGLRQGSGQEEIAAQVSAIIQRVRTEKMPALCALTRQFDGWEASAENLQVTAQEIAQAMALVSPEVTKSLKVAAARIRDYSERQLPKDHSYTDAEGNTLGWKWTPLSSAGIYVPGGLAAYPSSVLMNAVPAKVAGVAEIIMCVPAPEGRLNPAVLAAAHIAGVDKIYKVGGAQAIAALAYGTTVIPPVDKIAGPGNAYVAEAKRQVFGVVGVDMVAGPSEILVVADKDNDPAWVAADLLSQAEHDEQAQAVLITDSAEFATAVEAAIQTHLKTLPRAEIARKSWEEFGGVIVVRHFEEAITLIDMIAAEHVELLVSDPKALAGKITHAGALFLGKYTPEAIGDYVAGPSHVLPTSATARFSSGLSVLDFMKRTSLIGCSPEGFNAIRNYAGTLADAEGLGAHALSIRLRT